MKMRRLFCFLLITASLSEGGQAQADNPEGQARLKACAQGWQVLKAEGNGRGWSYQVWMQQCLKNNGPQPRPSKTIPPALADGVAPKDATAQCRDGVYTTTKARPGACTKHGGVLRWLQDN